MNYRLLLLIASCWFLTNHTNAQVFHNQVNDTIENKLLKAPPFLHGNGYAHEMARILRLRDELLNNMAINIAVVSIEENYESEFENHEVKRDTM